MKTITSTLGSISVHYERREPVFGRRDYPDTKTAFSPREPKYLSDDHLKSAGYRFLGWAEDWGKDPRPNGVALDEEFRTGTYSGAIIVNHFRKYFYRSEKGGSL